MKFLSYIILLFLGSPLAKSQLIETPFIWNPQEQNHSPIIQLGEQLIFEFDDLDADYKRFQYTIEHCDFQWNKSDIFKSDYIKGFQQATVNTYEYSENTYTNYTHYKIPFPNKDLQITKSGNYKLKVFLKSEDKPITVFKFSVFENSIGMISEVTQAQLSGKMLTHQQVNFEISDSNFNLNRNLKNLKVVVLQNENWTNAQTFSKPTFINQNNYIFNQNNQLFEGGSEYNFFDTKSLMVASISTERVDQDSIYVHTLRRSYPKKNYNYIAEPDLNGEFYIRDVEDDYNSYITADYVGVNFSLVQGEIPNKSIYIVGRFNNWKTSEKYKMTFNPTKGLYELKSVLKQGYYNYKYVLKDDFSDKIEPNYLSGSSQLAENNYTILTYFKPWNSRLYRLVGASFTNSQ